MNRIPDEVIEAMAKAHVGVYWDNVTTATTRNRARLKMRAALRAAGAMDWKLCPRDHPKNFPSSHDWSGIWTSLWDAAPGAGE
jgi:hypothetical protein